MASAAPFGPRAQSDPAAAVCLAPLVQPAPAVAAARAVPALASLPLLVRAHVAPHSQRETSPARQSVRSDSF